jgi:hypothetical protein
MTSELVETILVQAILWLGIASLALGLFVMYYATAEARYKGIVLLLLGVLCLSVSLFLQLPSGVVFDFDTGLQDVDVLSANVAVVGGLIGVGLGIGLFIALVWKR